MNNDHIELIWIGARVAVVGVLLPVLVIQVWNRPKHQTPEKDNGYTSLSSITSGTENVSLGTKAWANRSVFFDSDVGISNSDQEGTGYYSTKPGYKSAPDDTNKIDDTINEAMKLALTVIAQAKGTSPGLLDYDISMLGTNNIIVGYHAGWTLWTNSNVVLIGRHAETTNDNELVIRFVDAPEFRMKLPGVVDMRGMYPSWPFPSSTK